MPDLSVAVQAKVADNEMGLRASATAARTRVLPTGRALRFTSCDIFRVQDGRIIEHWTMGDIAGVLTKCTRASFLTKNCRWSSVAR
jgi:predicted ester cyclase